MHIGRNISKIRELLGVKQETLAANLKISQQTVSKIEQNASLSESSIERIASALGINAQVIMNYSDELLIDFFKNADVKPVISSDSPLAQSPLFEKIIELYERLLIAELESTKLTCSKDQEIK